MEGRTVLVIGTGTMGRGIAQVSAQAGYRTLVHDASEQALSRSLVTIQQSVRKRTQRGEWDAPTEQKILARLHPCDLSEKALAQADVIIEAIPEHVELKCDLFRTLDAHCRPEALLASNTSSIPITLLAAVTKRPERVAGLHFMNPVPTMKGVEIVQGRVTSPNTMEAARGFVRSLGKIPIVAKDYAGFITSRILNIYLNEAAYTVMDGNDPVDVDNAAQHCFNMPMGPCRLMDMCGIDIVVFVLGILREEFGDKFLCAPVLKQMVRAGHLGVKTGRGFYTYENGKRA